MNPLKTEEKKGGALNYACTVYRQFEVSIRCSFFLACVIHEESIMATDETVLLRNVLAELRSIRFRLDRQVAMVQRIIKISQKPIAKKKVSKKKAKTVKAAGKKVSKASVGYVKERKALARRLRKKALR